ncbi:MAG: hypothetical protein Q9190_000756 [Brigantiaea leucoxantha]
MPRSPAFSDFPSSLHLTITPPPSPSDQSVNILLLLHGLGDTHHPFTSLASQLSLPETHILSIRGPSPLPFDLQGYYWGDDIVFNNSTGALDYDTGFTKSVSLLTSILRILTDPNKCGYPLRNVLLLGYGQGGMAALALALSLPLASSPTENPAVPDIELGGIISVGGPLPSFFSPSKPKSLTPLLVAGGSSHSLITVSSLKMLREKFENVEYVKWGRSGDTMPKNRGEMEPLMRFLGRRMRSRKGVPEGAVEVG